MSASRVSHSHEATILRAVEARADETRDLLARLVRIPSLTGEEGPAQAFMADQLRALGLEVETWEPDVQDLFARFPDIAQYPSHWQHDLILPYDALPTYDALVRSGLNEVLTYRGRPNVVGRLGGSGGGRSLILNGHVDVVTVEPREAWRHAPFGAEVEDGRMYGRGSSDMKSGLVAALAAIRAIRDAGVTLRGDLIFQSVVNEEHAGNGTLACVARGITADAAIVLEPSDRSIGVTTHGGLYWGVLLRGRQVGTAARWQGGVQEGISAIEKLPLVIQALLALEQEQNRVPPHPLDGDKRPFSLTMGIIRGGTYETATAAECLLKGSVYISPAIGSIQRVMALLKEAVARAAAADSWLRGTPPAVHFYHHDDASEVDPATPIARTLSEAAATVFGAPASIRGFGGACDMRYLVNTGRVPTVVFGPGSMRQAHKADEHLDLAELVPSAQTLALAISRWCG